MMLQNTLIGGRWAVYQPGGIKASLDEINVGQRLREIRRLRRLTLKQVAKRSGLSESFISQVERAQASASIASLQRIAAVLGISIAGLFELKDSRKPQLLRKEDRPVLSFSNLGRKFLLTPRPLEHLEVFIGELDPEGSTGDELYTHGDSEELFIVLAGEVRLQLGTEEYKMSAGDSVNYRSSMPHRVVNVGDEVAQVMWVISPPSY
jgi:transcriptional regulator with XRE-family HTH domain